FYAVSEKLKAQSLPASPSRSFERSEAGQAGSKSDAEAARYVPQVTLVTKKVNDKIQIIVKDNGTGIPQNIVDKIFQPFFTTKPTGDGTGLGLSLSYDIIKAHGGEIKLETNAGEGLPGKASAKAGKEDEGTEFIIQLPLLFRS
ncbi:MAG TPA: HAMP domain-containing sensor histidine kinase, partial [Parafilimonas sp.]|nr:HAMP domain-containing sensor histidine kinase [Parafilimonas sp.]